MRRGSLRSLLTASDDAETRLDAIDRLRRGQLRAVFTVDIFNEGVDIPEVDTLLLLRPTESATIFLQQLGRGLRWAEGKSVLTVLDFIGQAHADYRFDISFRAMVGGTRRQVEKAVEHGFPLMPPGCAIRLDEISQSIVLNNLRSAIKSVRRGIVDDLRGLPADTSLPEFLAASRYDVRDVYSKPDTGDDLHPARRDAGFLRGAASRGGGSLLEASGGCFRSTMRSDTSTGAAWLTGDSPLEDVHPGSRQERLLWMLFGALGQRKRPLEEVPAVLEELGRASSLKEELVDLLDVLRERVRLGLGRSTRRPGTCAQSRDLRAVRGHAGLRDPEEWSNSPSRGKA